MNKKFVVILVMAAMGIILLSSGVRNLVLEKSARDFSEANTESMKSLLSMSETYTSKKDYVKAKSLLREFVERFPDSEEATEAKSKIETLNILLLFSDSIAGDSLRYQIQPGDTLSGIASKFGTTVELLKKANGLEKDIIIPNRWLKISKAKYKIFVDKKTNTLALETTEGELIKTYMVSTGKNFSTPVGTFTIEEKLVKPVWYKVGAVVDPASDEYELGSRWMGLSIDGYGIHGTKDETTIGEYITKGCVRMRNSDVDELYSIVPSGTEVTIMD